MSIYLFLKETTLFDKLLCYTEGSASCLFEQEIKLVEMGLELLLWNPLCLKTNNKYTEGEGRELRQQLQLLFIMLLTTTLLRH